MSAYYYGAHHAHLAAAAPAGSNSHNHHGRNRRAPRLSVSQNANRQFRTARSLKEISDSTALSTFRTRFEATRSFDLEDDMEFCPTLLSDVDLVSIHSSSERSSLASGSPESSPMQHPQSVAPSAFSLNSSSPPFVPPTAFQSQSQLHQPAATRGRNAIPIINPNTGISMGSPPPSVSPSRMQQSAMGRRW